MTIQFDEKGKIFTNIIQKETVIVTLQTLSHRIHGTIYVRKGERLKDEMDQCSRYLPVTDATVFDLNEKMLFQTSFMVINVDQIVWLIPDADMVETYNNRETS